MKFGDWADDGDATVYDAFKGDTDMGWEEREHAPHVDPVGEILCAAYDSRDYSGEAIVIVRINGVVHEVYGSHCSCYGLEGQWDPTPVVSAEFRRRVAQWLASDNDPDRYDYGPDLRAAHAYIAANLDAWGL